MGLTVQSSIRGRQLVRPTCVMCRTGGSFGSGFESGRSHIRNQMCIVRFCWNNHRNHDWNETLMWWNPKRNVPVSGRKRVMFEFSQQSFKRNFYKDYTTTRQCVLDIHRNIILSDNSYHCSLRPFRVTASSAARSRDPRFAVWYTVVNMTFLQCCKKSLQMSSFGPLTLVTSNKHVAHGLSKIYN
jgi:hypothetical protein